MIGEIDGKTYNFEWEVWSTSRKYNRLTESKYFDTAEQAEEYEASLRKKHTWTPTGLPKELIYKTCHWLKPGETKMQSANKKNTPGGPAARCEGEF